MKFMTLAILLSSLALSACGGGGYGSWSPRPPDVSQSSPVDCQRGIGICPGVYGRAGQMRRNI